MVIQIKQRNSFYIWVLYGFILLIIFAIYIGYEEMNSMSKQISGFQKQIVEDKPKVPLNSDGSENSSDQTKVSQEASKQLRENLDDEKAANFIPMDSKKFLGFDKLIGFKAEKKAVDGFMDYLGNQQAYQNIGQVESPLGILMYGCPGTGKTTLARALAKEVGLPFFEVSSSLFSQKYKGVAVELVQGLFKAARVAAQKSKGAIVFLDECETIFADLTTLEAGSEIANVVNQFKTEMTSVENDPFKPLFIIGATNHIHRIDEAIKSRFTYNIEVKPGTKEERVAFLEFMIKKRKNPYSPEAKKYLLEVINEALEKLPLHQEFLRANRTLENILKTAVSVFAQNRTKVTPMRNEINIEDLKTAFSMIISTDLKLLEDVEKIKQDGKIKSEPSEKKDKEGK